MNERHAPPTWRIGRVYWMLALGALGVWCLSPSSLGQSPSDSPEPTTKAASPSTQTSDAPTVQAEEDEKTGLSAVSRTRTPKDPTSYGKWVMLPAIIAILLAS